ncbi:MAG: hypothetical protein L0332_31980 [Chloroflexi bacterium]|nr:hypothetical protein [Chloroflexota bacterium]MCI0576938.1 hypothetical protein [Chloroflexota bacterium]MCI0644770.1 hypothetical protein [Chloroflexota bacterium]MCI0731322.1 hypothetical protein [Chloroflexota bacterium]
MNRKIVLSLFQPALAAVGLVASLLLIREGVLMAQAGAIDTITAVAPGNGASLQFLPFMTRPYLFVKSEGSPFYLQNYANNDGCDWLGVGGELFDLNGQPVEPGQYLVHLWGNDLDETSAAGSALAYGPSGWEVALGSAPVVLAWQVEVLMPNWEPVSPAYTFETHASCSENLVYFVFLQTSE